jgi:hypothetical protein
MAVLRDYHRRYNIKYIIRKLIMGKRSGKDRLIIVSDGKVAVVMFCLIF